ncbi:MAG: NUDIX domain-containing protein [Actinobacteria bacterium]|nr:NUDIX domain-containing protein [Actinomycetota bacterium]
MGRFSQAPVARAAGGVVLRRRYVAEVLVVHRPRYDDWALPKGHVDDGESWIQTARREVLEETGVEAVEVGPPLIVSYALPEPHDSPGSLRVKVVALYPMRAVDQAAHGDANPASLDDTEVDAVRWWTLVRARRELTYDDERRALDQLVEIGAWSADVR